MIRENQKYFNLILIVADITVIIFSLILAWYLRFQTSIFGDFGESGWGFTHYMIPLVVIIPMYLVLYYVFGLYRPRRTNTLVSEIGDIIKANFIGLIMLTTLLFLFELMHYSRTVLAAFVIFSILFTSIERMMVRGSLRAIRSKGYNIKHILVVGAGELGHKFALRIKENPYVGYNILGFLDDTLEKGHKILNSEVIGKISDLEHLLLTNPLDRVVITLSPVDSNVWDLVELCENMG